MAFAKKTWKDRVSQYPNRRTINDGVVTKQVTVGRDEGTTTEAGDAFDATNMNDLEDRIDAGFSGVVTNDNIMTSADAHAIWIDA